MRTCLTIKAEAAHPSGRLRFALSLRGNASVLRLVPVDDYAKYDEHYYCCNVNPVHKLFSLLFILGYT